MCVDEYFCTDTFDDLRLNVSNRFLYGAVQHILIDVKI